MCTNLSDRDGKGIAMRIARKSRLHRLIMAALVCICALSDSVALASDRNIDAFIIAIRHFDPQSATGIKFWGDEMRFTDAALDAAGRAVPELSALHIRTGYWSGSMYEPCDLYSLQVLDPISKYSQLDGDWGYIQRFAERFLGGCRGERVTREHDGAPGHWWTEKTAAWRLCELGTSAQADTSCKATAAADWLCVAGIRSVWIESMETDSDAKTGRLFLNFVHPVDLQYEAAKIMALPGYESIFGTARLRPFDPILVGGGDEIRVVKSEDCAGYEGIALLYSHGWNDCENGCFYRHWWKVKIKPQALYNGRQWDLKADTVEEGGDELSDPMRAALRVGVSRNWDSTGAPKKNHDPLHDLLDAASRVDLREFDIGH